MAKRSRKERDLAIVAAREQRDRTRRARSRALTIGGVLGIVVLDNPTDGTAYAVTSAEVAAVMAHIREQTTHEHCPE